MKNSILFRNLTILYPDASSQIADLLLSNGIIKRIASPIAENEISQDTQIISEEGLFASIGWFDMRALCGESGQEFKEDFHSLSQSAVFGGFTEVALLPNTSPVVQTKESIAYIKSQNIHLPITLHPIAALTQHTEGKEMTEMVDLWHAGAVAFSDGLHSTSNTAVLMRTLRYMQPYNALIMNIADDATLSGGGYMHEGKASTMIGMKGMSEVAEELGLLKDLKMVEFTGGKLHFSCISSKRSVELIRQAKRKGLRVSCDIASYHLAFTDEDLMDFDTNLKVFPPLRTQEDQKALWEGIADGTIDVICSGHIPQDIESKRLEFDMADFGMLNLQTAFAAAHTFCKAEISLLHLVEKFTIMPRQLLNMPIPRIAEGEKANLTIFAPEEEWVFSEKDILSKSKNSPFVGKTLKGKVKAICCKGEVIIK